jgi:DNA-binding CsgD family transcriptional regulator/PAS domain-containing protein
MRDNGEGVPGVGAPWKATSMDDQQLLTVRTTNAWLSLVAAMELGGGAGPLDQFVAQCPLPVAVIDLQRGCLTTMSPSASRLLGVAAADPEPVDVGVLTDDADRAGRLFDLLADGSIDAYEAHRHLRSLDDVTVDTNNWVAVSSVEDRSRALWAIVPRGERPGERLPLPTIEEWPGSVPGLVMGVLDGSWRIETISPTVSDLVGVSAEALRGESFIDLVAPSDVPRAYAAMARALHDRAPVGVDLRFRRHPSGWSGATAVLTPLNDPSFRIGFAVTAATPSDADADPARVTDLERHLLRIAQEIEAAGVTSGFEPITDPRLVPGFEDLTARQWDILRRLLRGERVPGISTALYLSQSAVRNHISTLLQKAGVSSQEALINLARAHSVERSRSRRP